ncbi:MAG TPA: RNA 2',3'-cyclic phosphodiesterase [Solirubrobacteraceae bacterium]|nr:RNA 2',3'-cyclic phosphodiesterase [Solirubrobacteraceae bacterium]
MSVRLFAAVDLPSDVVDALAAWSAGVAREGLRLLPPQSLHVTLAFLGHRPEEEVDDVAAAVAACASPVPGLRLAEAAWLPPRRPGVLAVDLEDGEGACGRLQERVSEALVALGVHTPEKRRFRPHVTVARVRKGARVHEDLPEVPRLPTFAAAALTLYRSRLGPKGASYDALSRSSLT